MFIDFNGHADGFVFTEDFEIDEHPFDVSYTTDAGRQSLVDFVHNRIEGDFDRLMVYLTEHEHYEYEYE